MFSGSKINYRNVSPTYVFLCVDEYMNVYECMHSKLGKIPLDKFLFIKI